MSTATAIPSERPVQPSSSEIPSSTSSSSSSLSTPDSGSSTPPRRLCMQIVIRRDLLEKHSWPTGSLMSQAAHAATAVLHRHRSEPAVQTYLDDLDEMTKLVLETPDLASLQALSDYYSSRSPPIKHHLWIEQPDNIPTALALVPNDRKGQVALGLKKAKVKLWREKE